MLAFSNILLAVSIVSLSAPRPADALTIPVARPAARQLPVSILKRSGTSFTKPKRSSGETRRSLFKMGKQSYKHRRQDLAGEPGHVDIINNDAHSRVASLLVNTTTYTLDASSTNRSTMGLVVIDGSRCILHAMINGTDYCATYDPSPPAPEPLHLVPCYNATDVQPDTRQDFFYDSQTKMIKPIWTTANATTASAGNDTTSGAGIGTEDQDDMRRRSLHIDARSVQQPIMNVSLQWVPDSAPATKQAALSSSMSVSVSISASDSFPAAPSPSSSSSNVSSAQSTTATTTGVSATMPSSQSSASSSAATLTSVASSSTASVLSSTGAASSTGSSIASEPTEVSQQQASGQQGPVFLVRR